MSEEKKLSELQEEVEFLRSELVKFRPTQPAPKGGTGDVWWEMIQHFGEMHPLHREMVDRRALGMARYGCPLQYGDGRDNTLDLREELLDASAYAWRGGFRSLSAYLLDLASSLEKRAAELKT